MVGYERPIGLPTPQRGTAYHIVYFLDEPALPCTTSTSPVIVILVLVFAIVFLGVLMVHDRTSNCG